MKPWLRNVINSLSPSVQSFETEQINLVLGLIIAEKVQRDAEYEEIYNHFTELYIKGRGLYNDRIRTYKNSRSSSK